MVLGNKEIRSPYHETKLWKINSITENYSNDCNSIKFPKLGNYYQFDKGFFHAYLDKDEAEKLCNSFITTSIIKGEDLKCSFKVVEGYIPENVRYAMNIWETEICARKIILDI